MAGQKRVRLPVIRTTPAWMHSRDWQLFPEAAQAQHERRCPRFYSVRVDRHRVVFEFDARVMAKGRETLQLTVPELCCAAEARQIEGALGRLDGVREVRTLVGSGAALVSYERRASRPRRFAGRSRTSA
jgi:copper chaperone CopZ